MRVRIIQSTTHDRIELGTRSAIGPGLIEDVPGLQQREQLDDV